MANEWETHSMSAMSAPLSPLGAVRVAVTVDDLLFFAGMRRHPGRAPIDDCRRFVSALEAAGVEGVYQFSNTAPLIEDAAAYAALDHWVDNGHHIGNHTHNHGSLEWMSADSYRFEIDTSEKLLEQYLRLAPTKFFRYCHDAWGSERCKCDSVREHLDQLGYTAAPVTAGFRDLRWHAAYRRLALARAEDEALILRRMYVASALKYFRAHCSNARALLGRDATHIFFIHGTSIAADCLLEILQALSNAGAVFVPLEEAMSDAVNRSTPPLTAQFVYHLEKFAIASEVPVLDVWSMHDEHRRIEQLFPMEGESDAELSAAMRKALSQVDYIRPGPFELPAAWRSDSKFLSRPSKETS